MTRQERTMTAPESGVKVRMYRPQGLGDCFLLAFRAVDGSARYMLIDFGVFMGTDEAEPRMERIAEDIREATGGHVHVLAVTHEHWDHLSGFHWAKELFDTIQIGEVWMAWTEDPGHALGQQLHEERARLLQALSVAVAGLRATEAEAGVADETDRQLPSEASLIEEVLNFRGELGAAGRSSTAEQMEYVRSKVATPRYLRPGEKPIRLAEVEGIQIYVLGPPEDEALLRRSDPSRRASEVYEEAAPLDESAIFSATALAIEDESALTDDEMAILTRSFPFDPGFYIPLADIRADEEYGEFFKLHYGFGPDEEGSGAAWRRIDTAWMSAAGPLALKLDSDTNNTSLVLAIELGDKGDVLLFPGDAQVGNWLSWEKVSWDRGADGEDSQITGQDLVRRTVLYKVGHHGSHNATLRGKGLELMESDKLVAMIPVDAGQAQKKRWQMPFPPLYEKLQEKTKGRIIRADLGVPEKPGGISDEEWEAFSNRIVEDDRPDRLWIEYTVPLPVDG